MAFFATSSAKSPVATCFNNFWTYSTFWATALSFGKIDSQMAWLLPRIGLPVRVMAGMLPPPSTISLFTADCSSLAAFVASLVAALSDSLGLFSWKPFFKIATLSGSATAPLPLISRLIPAPIPLPTPSPAASINPCRATSVKISLLVCLWSPSKISSIIYSSTALPTAPAAPTNPIPAKVPTPVAAKPAPKAATKGTISEPKKDDTSCPVKPFWLNLIVPVFPSKPYFCLISGDMLSRFKAKSSVPNFITPSSPKTVVSLSCLSSSVSPRPT